MIGIITAVTLTAISMLLIMLAVIQRRDYVHECEVDGWIARRDRLNDEIYNLNESHASEIQNLHSVYQRKLDDADEKLRIESRSFASELEEVQDQRDVARAELGVVEEKIIEYCNTIAELRGEKAGYDKQLFEKERAIQNLKDDVSVLDRRLQDYDERIRLAISARLVAESQVNSIREVCSGK